MSVHVGKRDAGLGHLQDLRLDLLFQLFVQSLVEEVAHPGFHGIVAEVAAFLPAAWLLRKTWFYRQVLTVGSLAIALVACVWLVERVADIKLISA